MKISTRSDFNSLKLAGRILFVFFILSLGYAVLRYHIMGSVPWKDFPFFIMNKAVALCAFTVLTFNFSIKRLYKLGINIPESWMISRRELGALAGMFMFIHGLMSFLIFNKATYSKFFEQDGTITLNAGVSMFGGVLLFALLFLYSLSFSVFLKNDSAFVSYFRTRLFLLFLVVFSVLHLLFMGFSGWLNPASWHGGLPPISLVSFVFLLIGILLCVIPKKEK